MSQISIKEKILDLKESINIRNLNWSEWDIKFIRSLRLDSRPTIKQKEIIEKLWERI